jgi:hypothetical protein
VDIRLRSRATGGDYAGQSAGRTVWYVLMLLDFFSSEPKTIELLGYSIQVINGWWTLVVVPARYFVMWAIFRERDLN